MDIESRKGPRACTTCAKAKSRCIPGPMGSEKCERCHRLQKHCGSQTPAPPRAKKEPRPTKVAELEKRLDQLTSQLHATTTTTGTGAGSSTGSPLSERSRECERERERERDKTRTISNNSTQEQEEATTTRRRGLPNTTGRKFGFNHLFPLDMPSSSSQPPPRPLTPPSCSPSSSSSETNNNSLEENVQLWPTHEEASVMLRHYIETKTRLLPFVIIPPGMGEAELRAKRPLLWKAVMMAESFVDGRRQMGMGAELLEEIGVAALRKPRRSLDLVHGIQMLVSWLHYDLNGFQLTNLLFLCRSLCIVLGNTKDPGIYDSSTLEYMRAFAGCYYLNTIVFVTNKRQDVFMSTTFLDVCVRALQMTCEHPTDELLVHLVKIQKLAQTISFTLDADDNDRSGGSLRNVQLPLGMVIQSFRAQLDGLRAELPIEYQDDPALNAHFSIAELLLHETAIPDTCLTSLTPTDRLSHLWSCLQSTRAFQTNRFANDTEENLENPRFICLSAHDFVYTLQVSLKLTNLKAPGWDLGLVRKEVDLVGLLDAQIEHMQVVVERRARGRYSRSVHAACWGVNGKGQEVVEPLERILISLRGFRETLKVEAERQQVQVDAGQQGGGIVTPAEETAADMGPVGLEGVGVGVGVGEVDYYQDFQDMLLQTNSLEFADVSLEQWGF